MPVGNGQNGKDAKGRFLPGNQAAVGHSTPAKRWREAFVAEVTPERMRVVVLKLVEAALKGEPWAVKELLDRCYGRATLPIELRSEHTENLEVRIRFDGSDE